MVAHIIVEDNSMFVGEHFELEGKKDECSTEMEIKLFSDIAEVGWDMEEKNSSVKGFRTIWKIFEK